MIHILYRHTENISGRGKNRPEWFSYEKSLNNLLKKPKYKMHIILKMYLY
jgi:hypothetical protein